VLASVSYALAGTFVETLQLTGTANIDATGNSQANTLLGNDGNNVLNGLAGADMMAGGKGDDVYYVDNVGDKAVELQGAGTDTVYASVSYDLAGQFIELLELTGSHAIDALGNSQANTLVGHQGDNVLTGRGGADLFGFRSNFGHDAITDFGGAGGTDGDRIAFGAGTFTSFEDVLAHASMVGTDTVIALNASDSVTLQNKQLSSLTASNFVFGGF
jgi:Ca2+-binding RTX toxin-like protein